MGEKIENTDSRKLGGLEDMKEDRGVLVARFPLGVPPSRLTRGDGLRELRGIAYGVVGGCSGYECLSCVGACR